MALIPEKFIDSIVSIGIKSNEEIKWIATGFVVGKLSKNGGYHLYLVTNKHVIKNNNLLFVQFNDKNGEIQKFTIPVFQDGVPLFEELKNGVDVIVFHINASVVTTHLSKIGLFDIDSEAMDSTEYKKNGGSIGDYVYMLGYPMGLVISDSISPICRAGAIARYDSKEIAKDKHFLVDLENYPGSSGSPIILKPELVAIKGTQSISRSALLGIISAYIPYNEALISAQTGDIVQVNQENSGLAIAHPVEFIRQLIDQEMEKFKRV